MLRVYYDVGGWNPENFLDASTFLYTFGLGRLLSQVTVSNVTTFTLTTNLCLEFDTRTCYEPLHFDVLSPYSGVYTVTLEQTTKMFKLSSILNITFDFTFTNLLVPCFNSI